MKLKSSEFKMATKRSASSFQNQPSKKKTYYGNRFLFEDVYSTADTQYISEWLVKEVNPNKQLEDLEPLVMKTQALKILLYLN